MAALAITVASEVKIGQALRNDLMAEGYATLGKIRRLAREFTGARDAYTRAWAFRQDGTSDPLVDARLMREEAAWFMDLGDLDEAEALLRNARKEYQGINDTHREGRTLLELGTLWTY
jgi:tetratricopeptide (TPR) repeat protein